MKILLLVLGICYILSPFDLVPDFLLGFGWLDDLAVLFFLWKYIYVPFRQRYRDAKTFREQGESYQERNYEEFFRGQQSDSTSRPGKEKDEEDPWTVLGIGRNASDAEIKKAYRELALKYHPDRLTHLGEEFRVLAENRFKKIQRAYQELCPR